MSEKISSKVAPGVATGDSVKEIFRIAKQEGFSLPAVNAVGTDSVNAIMQAAKEVNSPVKVKST